MTWLWLARREEQPDDASAVVACSSPDGAPAGSLAAWDRHVEQPEGALRVDHRLLDGGGDLTWVSVVVLGEGAGIAFDDGAVTRAIRRRIEQPWPGACSTLLVDWATFGGAVTAGVDRHSVEDDPFARFGPRELLRVPAGALGTVPAPTGPAATRYGSGNPWPWDRYGGQVS